MSSVSDFHFDGGIAHIDALHGEAIFIVTGLDEGKTFRATFEFEEDQTIDAVLSPDNRKRRMVRFFEPPPRIGNRDVVRTEDGQRWLCTKPGPNYKTTDFELVELHATKDS